MTHTPDTTGAMLREIDRILARLDREIPQAQQEMDALLSRLRTGPPEPHGGHSGE